MLTRCGLKSKKQKKLFYSFLSYSTKNRTLFIRGKKALVLYIIIPKINHKYNLYDCCFT